MTDTHTDTDVIVDVADPVEMPTGAHSKAEM